ncbi:DUF4199 domain-containing protein [Mucilaginibacter sp.]
MEATVNQNQIVLKWTIISVITSIVITYVFQFANVDQSSGIKYLSSIPFIIYLFLVQKEYKDQLGGYISFGQAFSTGFKYAIFSGIILAIFTYLYLAILSPQVYEKAMTDAQQKLTDQGQLSSEQIDSAMEISRKYGLIFATVGIVIFDALIGAILSLIGAAIFKHEKPLFITESDEPTVNDPIL